MEKVSKDTDRDFILTADQAVEYGTVDEIITSRGITPVLAARGANGSEEELSESSEPKLELEELPKPQKIHERRNLGPGAPFDATLTGVGRSTRF
jgi:hypothetical protein